MYLIAINAAGEKFFYTGRAGAGWVSTDEREAFDLGSAAVAQDRADRFNSFTSVHGLTFSPGSWHHLLTDTAPLSVQGRAVLADWRGFPVELRVEEYGEHRSTHVMVFATEAQVEAFYDHHCP